jgi:deoxycytidine triphosphate deaminase
MMLGKSRIMELVENGGLIENFNEKSLGGAGYDLRIDKIHKINSSSHLGVESRKTPDVKEEVFDHYTLKPGEYVLVETLEKVNMPSDVAARILPRSTLFRCGCALYTALVDPGFNGTLTMGLRNHSTHDFKIEKHARIAQIVFEEVGGKAALYEGKYQGGKVV